ncbi:hypothetical protein EDD15DRAFT_2219604 [Pisolithus albus]|nr:hypothetical protein EDD15DRAFT_2219604 [Pisolithus albus]
MSELPNPVTVAVSCQWGQCDISFPGREELLHHIRQEHIIPMSPMRKDEIFLMKKIAGEKIRALITIPGYSSQMDESPTLEWPCSDEEGEHAHVAVPSQGSSPSPDNRPRESGLAAPTEQFEALEVVESLNEPQALVGCTYHSMPQTQAAYHSQDMDSSQ